jgi:phosphate/sulfate permease
MTISWQRCLSALFAAANSANIAANDAANAANTYLKAKSIAFFIAAAVVAIACFTAAWLSKDDVTIARSTAAWLSEDKDK